MQHRILVVGLGSIGKRHARLIRQHFSYEVVALRGNMACERNDLGIPEIHSWEEVDDQHFSVAVVSNPTNMHIVTAIRCAERGMHLFVEKPIDCRLSGLADLIRIVEERQLSTYVAYPLRFHPVVREVKNRLRGRRILCARLVSASFLPDWRPGLDHRQTYSVFADRGGGVLLDMSHELDTAEYLFGPVLGISGKLNRASEITVDSDDCADLLLAQNHGTTSVHLDYFSQNARRSIEIETPESFISADLRGCSIRELSDGGEITSTFSTSQDEIYLEQFRHYFSNLGRLDMDNNLISASGLYRRIIEFREGQGYGPVGNHLRPGGVAGSHG